MLPAAVGSGKRFGIGSAPGVVGNRGRRWAFKPPAEPALAAAAAAACDTDGGNRPGVTNAWALASIGIGAEAAAFGCGAAVGARFGIGSFGCFCWPTPLRAEDTGKK